MSVKFEDFVADLLQDPYFLAKYEAYRAARDAGEEIGDEAELAAVNVEDLEKELALELQIQQEFEDEVSKEIGIDAILEPELPEIDSTEEQVNEELAEGEVTVASEAEVPPESEPAEAEAEAPVIDQQVEDEVTDEPDVVVSLEPEEVTYKPETEGLSETGIAVVESDEDRAVEGGEQQAESSEVEVTGEQVAESTEAGVAEEFGAEPTAVGVTDEQGTLTADVDEAEVLVAEPSAVDVTDELAAQPPKRKRRLSKGVLIVIILAEIVACIAAGFCIFETSWDHIIKRRSAGIAETVSSFDGDVLTDDIDIYLYKAKESIKKEVEEDVWTTEDLNYRVGPGTTYERIGTLNKYTNIKRTGITYNGWSRITINDQTYYVLSEFLTDEAPVVTEGGSKGEYQKYALSLLSEYGWSDSEITPLIKLWNRESNWNPNAHNRHSGAHGIPQALPASKMSSAGPDYYTNGFTQIRWGLGYIKNRYGSPSNAWAHSQRRGWY